MSTPSQALKAVSIYTDGACSGNPGPGGWAAILRAGDKERVLSGGERLTTNNRMELMGPIEALKALKQPCRVTLYSDSKYLTDAINKGWLRSWKRMGWKRKTGPLLNPELWQELDRLLEIHPADFVWVKGHSDHELNARCDELAVAERLKFQSGEVS